MSSSDSNYVPNDHEYVDQHDPYTAHNKFMNTSTIAESVASFILEGRYLENQTS